LEAAHSTDERESGLPGDEESVAANEVDGD